MKREPRQPRRATKRNAGKAYQLLVAEVARAFDAGSDITEGQWINGPDGRLDMDVAIRGTVQGRSWLAVIECKDYDIKSTGKVGRELVDALDSKRHDLGADIAIICSNSGFTQDALNKASRKGIGTISVTRRGDDRVKAVILEPIYIQWAKFGEQNLRFHQAGEGSIGLLEPPLAIEEIRYDGEPVALWAQHRAVLIALDNPGINEPITADFRFKSPITCSCRNQLVEIVSVSTTFSYTTTWTVQTGQVDSAIGIYDYACRMMKLAPGENQYTVGPFDSDGGTPCDPPPMPDKPVKYGVTMTFKKATNLFTLEGHTAPILDPQVLPEDLLTKIPDCHTLPQNS